MRGKQPEMAKRNEHGMGISPRALGRDATARFDLGMRRDRTGSFLEWRRRATSSGGGFSWGSCDEGKGERWMRQGRSGFAPMDSEIVMAAATYWRQEEERRRLGMKEDSVCSADVKGGWRCLVLSRERATGRSLRPRPWARTSERKAGVSFASCCCEGLVLRMD